MKTIEKIAVIVFALLFAAAWGYSADKYQEVIDQTYPLTAGGSVSLDNVNGDVSIEVWERDEVRVHALKSAGSQKLLDELKVEIDATPSAVRIETRYPSSRHSEKRDHERSYEGNHTKVEYTLTVPRTAKIDDVDLVNGSLLIVGVEGGVEASTVNGNIVVREGAGRAELETVNGGIELRVDHVTFEDEIALETVNGTIDLYLARSTGAEIRAETVNGRLSNDLGIEVRKGKYVGASFDGTVGGGGPRIDLETVNGSIEVHTW